MHTPGGSVYYVTFPFSTGEHDDFAANSDIACSSQHRRSSSEDIDFFELSISVIG